MEGRLIPQPAGSDPRHNPTHIMTPTPTTAFTHSVDNKGRHVIRSSDGSGWKTSASALAEALGGKYTHRAHGYILSNKAWQDFQILLAAGWKAHRLFVTGQPAEFFHQDHTGSFSRRDALKLCQP